MKNPVSCRVALAGMIALAFTPCLMAAGHYELAWFRMWDRSENGGTGGNHVFQIWVFDEAGNRMPNVSVYNDLNGVWRGSTSPTGERLEIPMYSYDVVAARCGDGAGSTSDVTPAVRTDFGIDWGHYSWDAGFIFKADKNSTGTTNKTLNGEVWAPGSTTYNNPFTKSMVYSHQYWQDYFSSNQNWALGFNGPEHSQTFIATGVNRIMGVMLFPVQPANNPTRWRAEIRDGGPGGAVIVAKEFQFPMYFAQPLAFGRDDCPVTPGQQYTVTLVPLEPSTCSIYTCNGNNYANGAYAGDASRDMFGFVWGWDGGIGTHGILKGAVKDSNNAPIPNAIVTITDESSSTVVATKITSANGSYLAALPAGSYRVSVDRPGFNPAEQSGVSLPADVTVITDFILSPLVQELSNRGFEMANTYAWVTYGTAPPQVWRSGIAGLSARAGSYWAGTMRPGPSGAPTRTGGLYQRIPALMGEGYQAVYNMYTGTGGGLARIGIDPYGGTDPNADGIVWSSALSSEGGWSSDSDTRFRATATAYASHVTVFVDMYTVNTTSLVAFDEVRLFRTTGPGPYSTTQLDPGWNLVSVPLVASTGEPAASVLDDVIAAGNNLQNQLYRHTGSGYETYNGDFANIDPTRGYWMNLGVGATELISASLPADPASIPLLNGWTLVGVPYRYGTPLSGLRVIGPALPAWRDDCNGGKIKYRSDNFTLVSNAETAIEWKVYLDSSGGSASSQPRLLIHDGLRVEVNYNTSTRSWQRNESGMSVTSGGIGGSNGRVYMSMDEWHTVRLYYNRPANLWRLTIDGKTDPAHQMSGTASTTTSNLYIQWGIVSSGVNTDMFTNYLYWGQNAEIDNWPESKKYDAVPGNGPSDKGWSHEFSTPYVRTYTTKGAQQLNMRDAALAGWVQESPVYYDDGYKAVKTSGGDDDALRSWKGYWIKANQSGLTLRLPASAESAALPSDVTSRATLAFNVPGGVTGSFTAALAETATLGYDATFDVIAPPTGPAAAKEVALRTTLSSADILQDYRPLPATGGERLWDGTVAWLNAAPGECQTVTVTWNVEAGGYKYELIDTSAVQTTPMRPGASYQFQLCEGQSLPFTVRATEGISRVDYNEDGYVDNLDFVRFEACASGPGVEQTDLDCGADADLDGDGDVDSTDFAIFQSCLSFETPADPFCP